MLYDSCRDMSAEATEDNSQVTVYAGDNFSFTYPADFTEQKPSVASWRSDSSTPGELFKTVYIPESFAPQTNFSEAWFTVGRSDDKEAVSSCLEDAKVSPAATFKSVTINEVPFVRATYGDGAAGNFYYTTSYRTVRDNTCYNLEHTIHSTNVQNYPPEMGIVKYDEEQVKAVLENMAQSFRFK